MAKKRRAVSSVRKQNIKLRRILYSVLVTLAVFVILYYFIVRPQGATSIVENGVGTVFTPLQNGVSSLTESFKNWLSGRNDIDRLKSELDALKLENTKLSIQIQSYDEMERENERLQVLLSAKETYESLAPLYAKVIAKDSGVWFDSFTINRGINDNIAINMAVVNADGLIGRIYEVGYNYAKVLSIVDSRSAVASLIGRTRDNGVMKGQTGASAANAECYMYYLPNVSNVQPGDTVFTSGLDSLFPKGLYIGTVIAISRESDTADKYAVISPAADFSSIEDVFVLRQLVETIDDMLPVVPTPSPRPVTTLSPTATNTASAYATQPVIDDNAIWTYPTLGSEATIQPSPTPMPHADDPVPELKWLDD